ncbi:DUF3558 domain-containing protein [Nocardia farcinica]|nr:DUF3558 domain-containing protein [Nocardia farcinica]MCZ9325089.1 DUF3558 domain-containing protein [Nocardia farcinica]
MGSRSVVGGVLALGVVVVLGGCDSSGDGGEATSASRTATVAADVPVGFDPCADIPQQLLDSENLKMKTTDNMDASGGIKWRGCGWVKKDGYAIGVQTTNITIDMVREKAFADAHEFEIEGRQAISTRRSEERPDEVCTVNVEMMGGSLEVSLVNPPSGDATGHLDTCDLARDFTAKVVPLLPAL